jgi:hypothetical protein
MLQFAKILVIEVPMNWVIPLIILPYQIPDTN